MPASKIDNFKIFKITFDFYLAFLLVNGFFLPHPFAVVRGCSSYCDEKQAKSIIAFIAMYKIKHFSQNKTAAQKFDILILIASTHLKKKEIIDNL